MSEQSPEKDVPVLCETCRDDGDPCAACDGPNAEIAPPDDPVCVCGENLRGHTYEHNFVDAEHYHGRVIPPGETS